MSTSEEAASLKQLYYGPRLSSDFKILYKDSCYNVHRNIIALNCKYFDALFSSTNSADENIIRLPIIIYPNSTKDSEIHPIPTEQLNVFFEIIYSNTNPTELINYLMYNLAVISDYLGCSSIDQSIQQLLIKGLNDSGCSSEWWIALFYAESYRWNEVKKRLIKRIGKDLSWLRADGLCKIEYDKYWSLLSGQTKEAILEEYIDKLEGEKGTIQKNQN